MHRSFPAGWALLAVPALLFGLNTKDLAHWGVSAKEAHEHPADAALYLQGKNPHPVTYTLPRAKPLSPVARLGKHLFNDASLSASGRLSCASCHDPHNAFEPPKDMKSVMYGGPHLKSAGFRPPPSLRYLYRQHVFSIGPDLADMDGSGITSLKPPPAGTAIAVKTANNTGISGLNIVPQGGLFLDGRVDTLQQQADGPLMNPAEMAAPSYAWVAKRLQTPYYETRFRQLFGPGIFGNPRMLISEMEFALARYQIEDRQAFYPFSSKYDAWLQGKAAFSAKEMRGYFAFNDPRRGNCAACHISRPGKDGLPPLFTDQQYEALGVPRNPDIPANKDPNWYDLGICGPFRTDFKNQTQYCGMFLTPTLRNAARKHVYFHNGRYTTLQEVLDFYNDRETDPAKIYPRDAHGSVEKYNDLPEQYRNNVDVTDPPFDRHAGQKPAMSLQDETDIIAFIKTLNDSR